MPYIYTQDFLW